jgi:hypothetical protein
VTILYYHTSQYLDPAVALVAIQHEVAEAEYDIETIAAEMLREAQEYLESMDDEDDDDEPNFREFYQKAIRYLTRLCRQPIPTHPAERVAYIRNALSFQEEGLDNIIAVTGLSDSPGIFKAAPVTSDMWRGIDRPANPSSSDVKPLCERLLRDYFGRGECLYFYIYDGVGSSPTGICFVGLTAI